MQIGKKGFASFERKKSERKICIFLVWNGIKLILNYGFLFPIPSKG